MTNIIIVASPLEVQFNMLFVKLKKDISYNDTIFVGVSGELVYMITMMSHAGMNSRHELI